MPMHELVPSSLQTKIFGPLRRVSFAGDGLPERMRSTAFAFLGLTAAAGLALVAIFAQLSFPLLSPAPLPSEPTEGSAVAKAVALDHGPGSFGDATPGATRSRMGTVGSEGGSGADGRGADPSAEPDAVAPAAPTAAEPGGGTSGGEAVETTTSSPAPTPPPTSQPAQGGGAPDPAPPAKTTPVSPRPAAPTPAPTPGNSQSSAAASHASERGFEASSKLTPESTAAGVAASGTSAPEASSGNGKALGHSR